jgi:hypothetical protein
MGLPRRNSDQVWIGEVGAGRSLRHYAAQRGSQPCQAVRVANPEAGCEKKCPSPYIGERFGENSVGGKWLMGVGLRIPLTLLGRRQGAVGG